MTRTLLRNIAIIAHVDHGKTTLVDGLLRQSGAFRANQAVAERALDSGDLERERGITILAKCTSVEWDEFRINIVDTPGHADFGGEVERILGMVDGVVLLVDAAEGPMPQTKFVLGKALKLGLRPIVVINKVDRPDARIDEVHEEVFDLFAALEANDAQLDFPLLYASGRNGWAGLSPDANEDGLTPLFKMITDHVPSPDVGAVDAPFTILATTLEADPYLGRILTGRIQSGVVEANMPIKALNRDGKLVEQGRVSKILVFRDLKRQPVDRAEAGDIVAIAGLAKATVADTLCDPQVKEPLAAQPVDPPTLSVTFSINDSPLAGKDGDKVQSRVIRNRLDREAEGNVAIRITETPDDNAFDVAGRGELQLGVLIEQMRREGFELSISRPRVLYRNNPDTGQREEPIEEVVIDVDEEYSGTVVESLSLRKGELLAMRPSGGGKVRLEFHVPTRGLIGYHGDFMTETRGTGVMSRLFHAYGPFRGNVPGRRSGVLISNAGGQSVAFALANLEERGFMFIGAGEAVYEGMIIGENARPNDLEVNPMKAKQLTNMRASGKDDAIRLTPPRRLTLEQAISYIDDDERVEVTPKSIRLRKAILDPNERKKAERRREAESA
ncbi:MAG: translational GTPase TypA [Rhodospirillaceae bacterium]|nr:translational GTPase TypA [Magnetovibrio sp.]MAY65704.1 translational GTPase TypA [Rhodospirillaceae bacterium]